MKANQLTDLFLKRRGYTPEYLKEISDPNHQKLFNVEKLAQILKFVHDTQSKIVIMPDFDCDGDSAGTVGYAGLSQLGFNVSVYIPHPELGYGIRIPDIKRVQQQFPDVKYIISCDVGITCYSAFHYANQQGIHVLITDHHEEKRVKPRPLEADVIVNPCQLAETYKLRGICGAHVFWQVLDEYARTYDTNQVGLITALRVFAGIGTVGDMMPMLNENRQLIKDTVAMLKFVYNATLSELEGYLQGTNFMYQRAFLGLKALLGELKHERKLPDVDSIDEKFLGWTLVPMYNAVKRMGLPMTLIYTLFFGQTFDYQVQAAQQLIQANNQRKTLVGNYLAQIRKEVVQGLQPFAPFIYLTDGPGGMLGLLANQLDRESGLPTFVINRQNLAGSGRSFDYFPVISGLANTEFRDCVNGHEEAFGIRFKDPEQIGRFYEFLVKYVYPLYQQAQSQGPKFDWDILIGQPNNALQIDEPINLHHDYDFYDNMQALKPFGQKFPEPNVAAVFKTDMLDISRMGSDKQHLKIKTPEGLELLSWNSGNLAGTIQDKGLLVFKGELGVNNFMGQEHLQMVGDFDLL